ncbi:MAG TPA: hypothetical protein VKZ53_22390 [Candidatus Angelobacter sp.]|nr:hypothetical protein [Candidatus Angelobacter sp.]
MEDTQPVLQKISDGALLPLDGERAVSFIDGKFPYTFYFSRLTQGDWQTYFEGVVYTTQNQRESQLTVLDMENPGIDLVQQKLIRVEGYRGDFASKPGWQAKIMPRHLRPAAWLLRFVGPCDGFGEDRPFDPECIEVGLTAAWGITEPGKMSGYEGLIHRFAPVTAEHRRKFYRASSESRVVGGSRNGKTIHALRHRLLFSFYDELILSVDGYKVRDQPLTDLNDIRNDMDGFHKVKAVELLFAGASKSADAGQGE